MRLPTLVLSLALSLSASAQEAPPEGAPRGAAAARAAELLAAADRTLAAGGEDQAAAALIAYEQAAAWAAQGRASETYARARRGKAACLRALGQPEDALAALDEAVETARAGGRREVLVELLDERAALARELSRLDAAVLATREAALLRDELGRVSEAVATLLRLSELELLRSGPAAAVPALDAALERARAAGLREAERSVLSARAELALRAGDVEAAGTAVEGLRGLGSQGPGANGTGRTALLLARTLLRAGRTEEALPLARDAAAACTDETDLPCAADAREVLADGLLRLRRPREAVQEVLALVGLRRSAGDRAGELRAHFALARAFRQLGTISAAASALSEAEGLAELGAPDPVRAALRVEAARLFQEQRRTLEAARAWDEAIALARTDDGAWPEAPTSLVVPEAREQLVQERLDFLVGAGLWGLAFESCESCTDDGGHDEASLEELRDAVRGQDAPLLTWRVLDRDVLAWVLRPDGRLHGARLEGLSRDELRRLTRLVRELAPEQPATTGGASDERLTRALRRLADGLFGPLESHWPERSSGLLVRPPRELRGLPWGLLLEPGGEPAGRTLPIAELPVGHGPLPRVPQDDGTRLLVADLRDPLHPGMDVRRLIARLDGEQRRAAEAEASAAPPRSRGAIGGPRRSGASPATSAPERGLRRYPGGLVVLAGDAAVPGRWAELAPRAAAVVLLADCRDLEPGPLRAGAVVAVPNCTGEAGRATARRLLRSGARAVFHLGWDPGPAETEALTAVLIEALRAGASPAAALREAADSGLPSTSWGALQLLGGLR